MASRIQRLGAAKPYAFEVQGHWPLGTMLLAHLERLHDLKVTSKYSFPATDDFWATFTYKGFSFNVSSPFSYLTVATDDPEIPEATFQEVEAHAERYQTVWPWTLLVAFKRYDALPHFLAQPVSQEGLRE